MKIDSRILAAVIPTVLAGLGVAGRTIWKFFGGLSGSLNRNEVKLDLILTNHLPHMDQRIGRVETQVDTIVDHLIGRNEKE